MEAIYGHRYDPATEITVTPKPAPEGALPNRLPWDGPTRLARLNGVVAAGMLALPSGGFNALALLTAFLLTGMIGTSSRRLRFTVMLAAFAMAVAIGQAGCGGGGGGGTSASTAPVAQAGHSTQAITMIDARGANGIADVGELPLIIGTVTRQ